MHASRASLGGLTRQTAQNGTWVLLLILAPPRATLDPLETDVAVVAADDVEDCPSTEHGGVLLHVRVDRHAPDVAELFTALWAEIVGHLTIVPRPRRNATGISTLSRHPAPMQPDRNVPLRDNPQGAAKNGANLTTPLASGAPAP